MVVPAALSTGEPSIMLCWTEALKNCIKPLYPNAWPCSERVTQSSKCGSANGTNWSTRMRQSNVFWAPSILSRPWNPARPSLGVKQAPWPCMLWLGRKRYAMWMSPPFTCGWTKTAPTLSVIHKSSRNPWTSPWGRVLVSPPSTFFHPLVCFTLFCPCTVAKNFFSSVSYLCPGGAGQTHVESQPVLSSFQCRSHATGDLVYPRAGQSGGKGVHPGQDPWGDR